MYKLNPYFCIAILSANAMKKIVVLFVLLFTVHLGFSQDGALDVSFDVGSGANNNVYVMKELPNGKIILGGQFTEYNGNQANGIARLNADGSFDDTFNQGTGIDFMLLDVLIEEDGKMLIVGSFSNYNGIAKNCIARLNEDGTLDESFHLPSGSIAEITKASKQGNKYIISGSFSTIDNTMAGNIARLNYDGTIDTSFNSTGASGAVSLGISKSIVLEDQKILIVGTFTIYQDTSRNRIARLNADGTLDTNFDPGAGPSGSVYSVAVQEDGKYIIGGHFSQYNGTVIPLIARINTDGTLDTDFFPGEGNRIGPSTLVIQPDSKILAGGFLTTIEGEEKYLQRFLPDGAIDETFDTGAGFDNPVNIVSLQADGKILAGGWFQNFDNTPINRVLRLENQVLSIPEQQIKMTIYPNPVSEKLCVDFASLDTEKPTLTIFDISGKLIYQNIANFTDQISVNVSSLTNGVYFLKITSADYSTVKKFIKN